ncbi:hypothetical protein D3C81_631380 [compost metagenome]
MPPQHIGQGEKALAAGGQLDHRFGRRRRESGQYRLDAAYRTRAGRIQTLERPALCAQAVVIGRQRPPAETADELRAQAFFQHDHQIARLALVLRRTQRQARQCVGDIRRCRQAAAGAQFADHLGQRQVTVDARGFAAGRQLPRGIADGVQRIQRQGVDGRVGRERHQCRIQGPMTQAGTHAQRRQQQHQERQRQPPQPSRFDCDHRAVADPAPRPPKQCPEQHDHHGNFDHHGQQMAAQQRHPDFFGIDQIFQEQAIGTQAVFGHEARRGQLHEHQQHAGQDQPPPQQMAPGAAHASFQRQQQRQHRRDAVQQAQGRHIHPQPLQEHRGPAVSSTDPRGVPQRQPQSRQRQGDQAKQEEGGNRTQTPVQRHPHSSEHERNPETEQRTPTPHPWQRATPDNVLPDTTTSAARPPAGTFNAYCGFDQAAAVSGDGSPTASASPPAAHSQNVQPASHNTL